MPEGDMEQLVDTLYDKANMSKEARRETQVDDSAGAVYLPPAALNEIAGTVASLQDKARLEEDDPREDSDAE